MTPEPYALNHFATFPQRTVVTPRMAGTGMPVIILTHQSAEFEKHHGSSSRSQEMGGRQGAATRLMMENILIICINLTLQRKTGELQLNGQILFFTPLFTEYQRKVLPAIHF